MPELPAVDERALSFGENAELYHRRRPTYPRSLIDDVARLVPAGGRALEIGAGTGIATQLLAERGVAIDALEPDPRMAAINRREHGGLGVNVIESTLEDFEGDAGCYDLAFAAQAWHWVDREAGARVLQRVLAADGYVALFWNNPALWATPLRDRLDRVYAQLAPTIFEQTPGTGSYRGTAGQAGWADAVPGFHGIAERSFEWTATYDADSYIELLRTHSDHAALPADQRERLLSAVRDVIKVYGGVVRRPYRADLTVGRAGEG